jgi:hypothetical protein
MEVTRETLPAKFESVFPHLDERQRRLLMGAEARVLGHGGIRLVAGAAGVREATVSLGVDELDSGAAPQISPILLAAYTASARRVAPSLRITLPTWNFTVVAEMYCRFAIAPLLSLRAGRARTSRSPGVICCAGATGTPPAVHPADDDARAA